MIPIIFHDGIWTRKAVEDDSANLYVFTDNTDRDSGHNLISDLSEYAQKYGAGHHYPKMTTAVIRGLNNAVPISTQRWYHQGAKGKTGRWNDSDINEFKAVIDDEFREITKKINSNKYKSLIFPKHGIFNTNISNISQERTPLLYAYLKNKLNDLAR